MACVLVTGATGFIGSHLVRRLARQDLEVVALTHHLTQIPGVRSIVTDVRDPSGVRAAFDSVRPDVVYHLAGQTSVVASMRDPIDDITVNLLGTVHLATAAIASGVRRIVLTSSGGALYGDITDEKFSEITPTEPRSIYGISKLAAEQTLRALLQPAAVELSILRPGSVYGPGQRAGGESGVVAIFAEKMLRDRPVTIYGEGTQERDYVFVDDVVDALITAAHEPPATCIVATGTGTTTRELFELLADATRYRHSPIFAPERAGEVRRVVLDPSRAKATWNWEPRTLLRDGLKKTVAWWRRELRL